MTRQDHCASNVVVSDMAFCDDATTGNADLTARDDATPENVLKVLPRLQSAGISFAVLVSARLVQFRRVNSPNANIGPGNGERIAIMDTLNPSGNDLVSAVGNGRQGDEAGENGRDDCGLFHVGVPSVIDRGKCR